MELQQDMNGKAKKAMGGGNFRWQGSHETRKMTLCSMIAQKRTYNLSKRGGHGHQYGCMVRFLRFGLMLKVSTWF